MDGSLVFEPNFEKEPGNVSHVITGGVGGMGILMANVLVKSGAKSMILLSRRDSVPVESQAMYKAISDSNAQIVRRRVNSADAAGMKGILADNCDYPPVTGLVHAAGVLQDAVIEKQTRKKYVDVFQPKYNGAWILHHLTSNKPWDVRNFVMFSSVAAIAGNVGQSNHSAANAGMDMMSAFRNNNGLVASAINLGAIAEVGYAARHVIGAATKETNADKQLKAMEAAAGKVDPPANIGPPNQESEDKK